MPKLRIQWKIKMQSYRCHGRMLMVRLGLLSLTLLRISIGTKCYVNIWNFKETGDIDMLGSSALTLWQTNNCRMALINALGHVCKFVLRCKNLYRIGPWILNGQKEFGLQMVPISNEIWNMKAQPFVIKSLHTEPNLHRTKCF